eukprot:Plantae.Rhodophyta-Hildenbrandia_rubra.ctg11646.p1 GENE.Plantae.Rhodophyta-Hildenbrandia_rubra.ctg11646~~Plantae.Rhodophyta-Hildenbrandia_rubra.ctg11646.p1  ORF type:complete len:229 (-),score=55.68 Plantae.Rhodophyta-Hildenbrandia_rubra.ctg11646:1097-1762(-)
MDTKNQAWRSDTTSFGYRMLSKMGWKEGKGLGAKENGATSSIRVRRLQSGVGIGAETTSDNQWKATGQVVAGYAAVLSRLGSGEAKESVKENKGGEGKEEVIAEDGKVASRSLNNTREGKVSFWERKRRRMMVSRYSSTDLKEIFGGANVAVAVEVEQFKAVGSGTDDRRVLALNTSSTIIKKKVGKKGDKSNREETKRSKTKDSKRRKKEKLNLKRKKQR